MKNLTAVGDLRRGLTILTGELLQDFDRGLEAGEAGDAEVAQLQLVAGLEVAAQLVAVLAVGDGEEVADEVRGLQRDLLDAQRRLGEEGVEVLVAALVPLAVDAGG